MTYNVSLSSSSYNVKIQSPPSLKVQVSSEASSVASLSDLSDVNATGVQNGYLLMYDSATETYVAVDPDTVLSTAVTTNDGLPQDFINQLDVDLDNKIDLDAGTF